jgi:hypothetical protein
MDKSQDKKFEDLSDTSELLSYKSEFLKDLPLPLAKSFAAVMKLEIPEDLESLLEEKKDINVDQVEKKIKNPRKAASGGKKRSKGKGKATLSQEIVEDSFDNGSENESSSKKQKIGVVEGFQEEPNHVFAETTGEEIIGELSLGEDDATDIPFDLGEDL